MSIESVEANHTHEVIEDNNVYALSDRRQAASQASGNIVLRIPGQRTDSYERRTGPADRRRAVRIKAGEAVSEMLASEARTTLTEAASVYQERLAEMPSVEPETAAGRLTQVSFTETEPPVAANGWAPARAYLYHSYDPYQALNPDHVQATSDFIDVAMGQIDRLKITHDPKLTYVDMSRGGSEPTLITKIVTDMDAGIEGWVRQLPAAEGLRPVAKPWSDEPIIVMDQDGQIVERPQTAALRAFVGGGGDGRAVREREAWERSMMETILKRDDAPDAKLTITSLGTGTGEPAMDTALEVMKTANPDGDYNVVVNGFDISAKSLAIAKYVAARKDVPGNLQFNPRRANILSARGIEKAIGSTDPDVIEAIGFSEYVPSDGAPTQMERNQREDMKAKRCMSAQEFYGTIYANMPKGSKFLTGNMRDDSPQGDFITDGLGWPGIIRRSTEDYIRILSESGIPQEAVDIYMPDQDDSAAVYNLVAITKLED